MDHCYSVRVDSRGYYSHDNDAAATLSLEGPLAQLESSIYFPHLLTQDLVEIEGVLLRLQSA